MKEYITYNGKLIKTPDNKLLAIVKDETEPTDGHRVRFIDYDGTVLKTQYVADGENATPPDLPTHDNLTFQEWNNPYTNIADDIDICATYATTDGKTHFYLQITGGTGKTISLYSTNGGGGNIVINWGDGTADFSSTATAITASHTFADYGVYHCTIENILSGDFRLGQGSDSTSFCGGSSQQMRDALMAIYLGEKVQTSTHSFYYNYALKYVTIPNSVTSIRERAFSNCYSLTNITIPNSVTSIGERAIQNCRSLINVTIPNSVTSIGNYAFYNCSSLTNITIPNSVTSIGDYAFMDCYSLTNITIPNSVTRIGSSAFYNCSSLTNITIPNSVTSIGDSAFQSCYSLKKVLLEGDTVKTLTNSNAFTNIPKSSLFFVKDELVATYKGATNWSVYATQIMPMSEEANYYG